VYQKNNGIRSWYATVKEKGEGRERERKGEQLWTHCTQQFAGNKRDAGLFSLY